MRKIYFLLFAVLLSLTFIGCNGSNDFEAEDGPVYLCETQLVKVEDLRDESEDGSFRIRLEFDNGFVIFHEDYKYDTAVFWKGRSQKIYLDDNEYILELGSVYYGYNKDSEELNDGNRTYICESNLTNVKYLKGSDDYNFGLRLDFENGLVILYEDYDKKMAAFWIGKSYAVYRKKNTYNKHIIELKKW